MQANGKINTELIKDYFKIKENIFTYLGITKAHLGNYSDAIKDLLYTKSSEKLDALKPNVAGSMFDTGVETEDEVETPEAEVEVEDETTIEPEEGEEENVN